MPGAKGLDGWTARGRALCATALLIVGALLAGCAGPLQKPELSLAGVELIGLGLAEQRLLIKLRIGNPNDVELSIKALSFAIELNGRPVAAGASSRPAVVARGAEALLEIGAVSRLGELLRPLREARAGGKLVYRVHGRLDLDSYGSIPFDRSGELPRSALERFVGQ